MEILILLVTNLFPLYVLIGLGYIGGRFMDLNLESIAKILINFLLPVVAFGAVTRIQFEAQYLILPVVLCLISAGMAIGSYLLAQKIFSPARASLIGMASASGNTGYFGVPLIIALLGEQALGIYLLINFGITISEITVAYYLGARGNHTVLDSLKRVFKLPALYAITLALLFNIFQIPLPEIFFTYWDHATGAWILFGMMLIGIALGKSAPLVFNVRLNAWLGVVKFILWPLVMAGFIALDRMIFGLFDDQIYMMVLVIGVVPLAGNIVAYAAQLKVHPEETAMAVLASTIFALIYIPIIITISGF